MRQSINVSVLNSTIVANIKVNDDGSVKLNDKGNSGYYANGKVSLQIPATIPETLVVTVNGQPINAVLKRKEDGSVRFTDAKDGTPEMGNMGWRITGKANDETGIMQVGGDITICKCGGQLPTVGQIVTLQVGCNITRYTPAKAAGKPAPASNGKKKGKGQPAAAESQPQTVGSQPVSEDDAFMEQVRRLLAGK